MDTINSFKGYGKVDPAEEQAFKRKSRRRVIILSVSSVLLVAIIVGAVVGTVVHKPKKSSSGANDDITPNSASSSIKAVCGVTQYPDSCISSIKALEPNSFTNDPEELFKLSLHVAHNELASIVSFPGNIISRIKDDARVKSALGVCQVAIEDAIDRLDDSISSMEVKPNPGEKLLSNSKIGDLKTWLSSTITDQETCLDAIREVNSSVAFSVLEEVNIIMKNSTEFVSNSLAIVTKLLGILSDLKLPIHRKLLGEETTEFPSWVGATDRRLLTTNNEKVVPNVTVAKDGSGDCRTIKEAVAKVPVKSTTRFVIYVKAGVYVENVNLTKAHWNVMIYGDGKGESIVSGSLSNADNISTFASATFAVVGKNFIARDMGFKNTAGPQKHQAVALRSGSDFSVFYRCSFDAYQDTLYSHSNRQFYRECDITGTVDFIFGNAAVVFQKCNILPRQPMSGQFVTITAQGKKDINQNTGISIHKCTIAPLDKLTAPTYLGRPWKNFSTTIIMETTMGSFLDQSGWISWVNGVDPPSTIFYGEYQNYGPGSTVDKRVTWAGYKPIITKDQASKYSVLNFIDGPAWLGDTNVEFDSDLN